MSNAEATTSAWAPSVCATAIKTSKYVDDTKNTKNEFHETRAEQKSAVAKQDHSDDDEDEN